jgi:hypothetical protein
VKFAGTTTRRHTIGLMPVSQTLTCRIASLSDAGTEPFLPHRETSAAVSSGQINPYLAGWRQTPDILMLSQHSPLPESTSREDSPLGKSLRIVAAFTTDSITEDSTRPASPMVTISAADLIARIRAACLRVGKWPKSSLGIR